MKRSKIVNTVIANTIAMILASTFLSAQQPGQQKQPSQKGEMKSMGNNMSMEGMMKDCNEHHQAMTKSLDEATKALEGAKQSNDPAKMRVGIDQAQKQLADMKDQMAICGNMMNMMQKMQGGMMKGGSK